MLDVEKRDFEIEQKEWLDSLRAVLEKEGVPRAVALLETLKNFAHQLKIPAASSIQTPYVNSIVPEEQPPYPGNYGRAFLEGRINEEHLINFRRETHGNGISDRVDGVRSSSSNL